MNEYFPTVVQVIPLDNFHVQVFFDDGKIVDYDATDDLKAEIFAPLRMEHSPGIFPENGMKQTV